MWGFDYVSSIVECHVRVRMPYEVRINEVGLGEVVKTVKFWTKAGAVSFAKSVTTQWTENEPCEFDWHVFRLGVEIANGSSQVTLVRKVLQVPLRVR